MSYLEFRSRTTPGRKTPSVDIHSAVQGDLLGQVKWFGRWRQYAFFPEPGTAWNPGCLVEVNECIARLMAERRT